MPSPGSPPLPALRQDLAIYPAPAAPDGSPCWHLHDPAANRFYQIGWIAFEVLSRWSMGSIEAIVVSIQAETTLQIDADTVLAVASFLERHHMFEACDAKATSHLMAAASAKKLHWSKWLLHNYLFFRIPLVRPDAWLGRWAHLLRPALGVNFWIVIGLLGLGALVLVARHWEQYLQGFTTYSSGQTLLAFGIALGIAKMAHELGHAFVAKYHGCKVPTMGVAFLVLWPVLYTDTNEAWKLPSNQARFRIALAGMAAESLVAISATWAWLLLPDGPWRAAAFFVATTSWLMTVALNASPFLRFDGYFLLSDALGLPNLHGRAFAFGRWWLRERLFAWGDTAPESASPMRVRALVAFAVATWIYRFVLFLSIALLVYHVFFKILGLLLMLVEVAWFILRPLLQELEVWWRRRHGLAWNKATRRTAALLAILLLALLLPWKNEISAPAMLAASQEQNFYAPFAGRIAAYPAAGLKTVRQGEVLLHLESPELDQRLLQARIAAATWQDMLQQQAFSERLLAQGDVVQSRWQEATAQTAGLGADQNRLKLQAAFDGGIVFRADDLLPGTWVHAREKLLTITNNRTSIIEVFVGETEMDRVQPNAHARFVPQAPEFERRDCQVAEIGRVNLAKIDDLALASVHGGLLPSRLDSHGDAIPTQPIYRLLLDRCQPDSAPGLRMPGVAHIAVEQHSAIPSVLRQIGEVLVRESSF